MHRASVGHKPRIATASTWCSGRAGPQSSPDLAQHPPPHVDPPSVCAGRRVGPGGKGPGCAGLLGLGLRRTGRRSHAGRQRAGDQRADARRHRAGDVRGPVWGAAWSGGAGRQRTSAAAAAGRPEQPQRTRDDAGRGDVPGLGRSAHGRRRQSGLGRPRRLAIVFSCPPALVNSTTSRTEVGWQAPKEPHCAVARSSSGSSHCSKPVRRNSCRQRRSRRAVHRTRDQSTHDSQAPHAGLAKPLDVLDARDLTRQTRASPHARFRPSLSDRPPCHIGQIFGAYRQALTHGQAQDGAQRPRCDLHANTGAGVQVHHLAVHLDRHRLDGGEPVLAPGGCSPRPRRPPSTRWPGCATWPCA